MDAGHIRQSLGLQDRTIMKQREQKMGILAEILAFKFESTLNENDENEGELYGQIYGHSHATIRNKAIDEVSNLLERWEALAELYPHSMAMEKAVEATLPNQGESIFRKVETLQVEY
jgi:hypothetical protein